MGFESAVKAVETYAKIVSERVKIDINVDPVVLNALSSFALTFFLGHRIAEFSVRKAMGEYYQRLPETARSGMVGVYYFSSLVLVPLFTCIWAVFGLVAAAVLLVVLPYHHGKNLRRSLEEKEAKKTSKNVFPAGFGAQALSTVTPNPATPKIKKTGEEELAEFSMKIKILKAKVRNTIKALFDKTFARGVTKSVHKNGQATEQNGKPVRTYKTAHDSSTEEHKHQKPAIKLEDVLSNTETVLGGNVRTKKNAPKAQKTTKLEEVLPEYTVPKQKEEKKQEKEHKSREMTDERTAEEEKEADEAKEARAEVPEEIKTFRKVLDEMEMKYIKKKGTPGEKTAGSKKKQEDAVKTAEKDRTPETIKTEKAGKKEIAVKNELAPEKTTRGGEKAQTQAKPGRTATAKATENRKSKEKTDEPEYSRTTYNRIRTALKNILLEQEKTKLEKITWRDVRKIRKKVEQEVEKYHQKIIEEAVKLGERASKTDVDRAARRILGIEQAIKRTATTKKQVAARAKHRGKKETPEKGQQKNASDEDDGILSLLGESAESGEDDNILALLGDEGETGEDDDLSKLLKD